MDRERFDALTRLLATPGSRRATLGAILGIGLLGHDGGALGKPGHGNDKDRKRRKKRGGGRRPPPVESACGRKPCPPPEPGGLRAGCNYNGFGGLSFAGQDLRGSVFRGIDGRRTNFDQTDNRGSVFAKACLRAATFRGANLAGTTWDGACLVDADFTGADLGGETTTIAKALFCHTIMPDGSRNDRDCGVDSSLCRSSAGGIQRCTGVADCPDEVCLTKECDRVCRYEPVDDGPSPNDLCDNVCCGGECCPSPAYVCVDQEECCQPTFPTDCGLSGACAAACGESCTICADLVTGATQCGDVARLTCRPCASNADCPAGSPFCITGSTIRQTSVTIPVAQTCRNQAPRASCAAILPC